MRKKVLPLVVVIFLFALSQTGVAQQRTGSGPGSGKAFAPENFEETKARVLRLIEERRKRIDQEKACVQAARSMEELNKCRPQPSMGRGGINQPGSGRQRGPMPGAGQPQ